MNKLPFLLITLLFLVACNPGEDEPRGDLTTDEAIAIMEAMSDDASQDIIDLAQSEGVESIITLVDFFEYSLDFGVNERVDGESVKERALTIARIFGTSPASRVSNDDPLSYEDGVYEWDAQTEEFIFSEESEDLVFKFPVGESEINNGVFTLTDLEFDDLDLPTLIVADLIVDETTMVDLHFVVNWSSDEFPEAVDIYLFVNPFTFDLNFNAQGETVSFEFSIANGDETIAAIDLVSNLDFESEELPIIEGVVEYRGIQIAGRVDLAGVDNAISGETDPNDFIFLHLHVGTEQIGEIVLILETIDDYTDYVPYVVFEDGTKEPLEDLLESIFVAIEEELDNI